MNEISFEYIRSIQLDALLFFHNLCETNGLTYYLSNGTLLGAVKYSGYIPWDDDIDICMPRCDYQKLIEIWKQTECKKYDLFARELNDEYLFPFAKLSNTNTVLIEKAIKNGVTLGVNLDIFPLDGYGNNPSEAARIYNKMEKLRSQLVWAKRDLAQTNSYLKRIVKFFIALPYKCRGAKKICEDISAFAKQRDYSNDQFVGNVVWGFYPPGEAHRKQVFAQKIDINFENNSFWAPVGYDEFLQKLYGDYHKTPPKDKQVTHHDYKAYWKDSL